VIDLAQEKSLSGLAAKNRKKNRYWQYRVFKSNYSPQLRLNGTLPNYYKDIRVISTSEGDIFAGRNQLSNDVGLGLTQSIALTGGTVTLGSTLRRNDFYFDTMKTQTQYASSPLVITVNQPLFQFNELKWDKKIEPIRYDESVRAYNEEMEGIASRATNLYFGLLLAQMNYQIATLNKANNDTIFRIANGRYSLGKIAENELLQLELNVVTAEQELSSARLDMETAALSLNTFIGNLNNQKINLAVPKETPQFMINETVALEEARENRQAFLNFQRRKLEAEREVAIAKGQNGLQMNLFGQFGLNQQAGSLSEAYKDVEQQQQVALGFQIPIMDWGRQKARMQTSLANQELINNTVDQEKIQFEQEIMVLVRQFEIFRQRLVSTARAEDVSQRSYDIANKRYLVGKISVTDLNLTLQQKDRSKRSYLDALRQFWEAYYRLRLLTLHDFRTNEKIIYE
jgi:outer membrane protein TolC